MIHIIPKEIISIDTDTKSISISNGSCNDKEYTKFDFSRFSLLEELTIGDNCFSSVNLFKIDGLNHLKSLKIGIKSFTQQKDNWKTINTDSSRSFAILNCVELESIEIGRFSFSDYAGGFELKNLPKLLTIKIGERGRDSHNFYYSSFVIKGMIDVILLMNRSSTFEID